MTKRKTFTVINTIKSNWNSSLYNNSIVWMHRKVSSKFRFFGRFSAFLEWFESKLSYNIQHIVGKPNAFWEFGLDTLQKLSIWCLSGIFRITSAILILRHALWCLTAFPWHPQTPKSQGKFLSFKSVGFYSYFSCVCWVFLVCVSTHVFRHDYYNKREFLKYMTRMESVFERPCSRKTLAR